MTSQWNALAAFTAPTRMSAFQRASDGAFVIDDGEVAHECTESDGVYSVRTRQRGVLGDRGIDTTSIDVAAKFLAFLVGPDVRSTAGLARIPVKVPPAAPGTAIGSCAVEGEPSSITLRWIEDGQEQIASAMNYLSAGGFARLLSLSADELRASYLAADGGQITRLLSQPLETDPVALSRSRAATAVRALIRHPEAPFGWDESGQVMNERDWVLRYGQRRRPDGSLEPFLWPGNERAVPGTRVQFDSIGVLLREYPEVAQLDRLGSDDGHRLYLDGAPFEQRSLTPWHLRRPYATYELQRDVENPFLPELSVIAPGNGFPGGSWQLWFVRPGTQEKVTVAELKSHGVLAETASSPR